MRSSVRLANFQAGQPQSGWVAGVALATLLSKYGFKSITRYEEILWFNWYWIAFSLTGAVYASSYVSGVTFDKLAYRTFAIEDMKRSLQHITYREDTEALAKYAKALSHPTRIAIIRYLEHQSCCFTGDLVDVFPISQSTVSQHLKELKNAGLIQGELNPPRIKYCINKENWSVAKRLFEQFFK